MPQTELENIASRLEALESKRAIRDVISRYAHYADLGHEDAWVGLALQDRVAIVSGAVVLASGGWRGDSEVLQRRGALVEV